MSNKKSNNTKLDSNKKRLLKDVVDIMKHPLHSDGIHYFHDESNFQKGYAISPPKLTYLTNNGKTRFNPNLYRNGKVCISILNTWRGEQWTSCQTIRSVLLTLTTLFHNKPLLNEPGIKETHRDFNNYNTIIQYRNFETAILKVALQKLLPPQFTGAFYIIKTHLLENKQRIIDNLANLKEKEGELRTIWCGTYNMRCNIDYSKLYKDMQVALAQLN